MSYTYRGWIVQIETPEVARRKKRTALCLDNLLIRINTLGGMKFVKSRKQNSRSYILFSCCSRTHCQDDRRDQFVFLIHGDNHKCRFLLLAGIERFDGFLLFLQFSKAGRNRIIVVLRRRKTQKRNILK